MLSNQPGSCIGDAEGLGFRVYSSGRVTVMDMGRLMGLMLSVMLTHMRVVAVVVITKR